MEECKGMEFGSMTAELKQRCDALREGMEWGVGEFGGYNDGELGRASLSMAIVNGDAEGALEDLGELERGISNALAEGHGLYDESMTDPKDYMAAQRLLGNALEGLADAAQHINSANVLLSHALLEYEAARERAEDAAHAAARLAEHRMPEPAAVE